MTSAELKAARHRFGLSAEAMARLVRVAEGRTVRRWEAGTQDIPGPVEALVEVLLAVPAARRHFGVEFTPAAAQPDDGA